RRAPPPTPAWGRRPRDRACARRRTARLHRREFAAPACANAQWIRGNGGAAAAWHRPAKTAWVAGKGRRRRAPPRRRRGERVRAAGDAAGEKWREPGRRAAPPSKGTADSRATDPPLNAPSELPPPSPTARRRERVCADIR